MVAVRYPRGGEPAFPPGYPDQGGDYSYYGGGETLIVTYGRLSAEAAQAVELLKGQGKKVSLLALTKIFPSPEGGTRPCQQPSRGVICRRRHPLRLHWGAPCFPPCGAGYRGKFTLRAIENQFVPQASIPSALHSLGLDAQGIANTIIGRIAVKRGWTSRWWNRDWSPARNGPKSIIMAGQVYVNGQKSDKAGTDVSAEDTIEIRGETLKYVSRGGLKLEKAMAQFHLDLTGKICCDIGGLHWGLFRLHAAKWRSKGLCHRRGLRPAGLDAAQRSPVVNLERTNIRYVTEEQVPDPIDFISIDVSIYLP